MENQVVEKLVELGKRLRKVFDNKVFITEVLSYMETDIADMQKLISFIDAGVDVNDETITVLAMDLYDCRHGIFVKNEE